MKKQPEFPSREELDQAFHFLHDQINRIAILDEIEMTKDDQDKKEE